MLKINKPEYVLMKKYIEEHCGIYLEKDKEYLIETRLSDLAVEIGCKSFQEFHFRARTDSSGKLRDLIVDSMTTNETSWFRDASVWEYLEEIAVPALVSEAAETGKANVWCMAVSTGQEACSLLMLFDEAVKKRGLPSLINKIDILGTDISSSSLDSAISGKYDNIAISRGLPEDKKERYFSREGDAWVFDQNLKERVRFKKFNLQDSFIFPYNFDLILCRYVSIYFSNAFKQELYTKTASVLKPGRVLLLGATESLRDFSDDFETSYYKSAAINTKKRIGL
ncbi:MAG: protein-glutamate O-methyltransferase CheR [Desulfobacterales bacterium]|nr:protein-glutamate O-methyltransferase CheR [Desulfobacterales bacterium]